MLLQGVLIIWLVLQTWLPQTLPCLTKSPCVLSPPGLGWLQGILNKNYVERCIPSPPHPQCKISQILIVLVNDTIHFEEACMSKTIAIHQIWRSYRIIKESKCWYNNIYFTQRIHIEWSNTWTVNWGRNCRFWDCWYITLVISWLALLLLFGIATLVWHCYFCFTWPYLVRLLYSVIIAKLDWSE